MLKRFLADKRVILFLSLLGIISLMLLAGSLNDLTFEPVSPLRFSQSNQTDRVEIDNAIEIFLEIPLWKQIGLYVTIFLIAGLIASLLSPEARKRLLKLIVRAALIVLAVSYILRKNPNLLTRLIPQFNLPSGTTDIAASENIPPPVFEPPQVAGWLSFLIALGIVLVFAAIIWMSYLWWKNQNAALDKSNPLEQIVKVARASLKELSKEASRDAIIRCYENMSAAVSKRRGLQRDYSMTAAEFAQRLENAGLPKEPVQRLTRLFESARYGSRATAQKDVDEAVLCLASILNYCGEKL